MNILVTGGSGFIGTNLTTDVLLEGHTQTLLFAEGIKRMITTEFLQDAKKNRRF